MHRPQMPGGPSDPVGQGRAIQADALPGIDLSLPVERQMISIFRHQHLRDQRVGGQPALDHARRSGRLHHSLAGAAGVFGSTHDQHAQLRRHDIEPLGDILADAVQGVAAAGTGRILDVDDRLHPRQMGRQRSPVPASFGRSALALGRIGLIVLGFRGGLSLFGFFQPQQQLIFGQALGPAAEAVTLHRLDDLLQAFSAGPLGQEHGFQQVRIIGESLHRAGHKPK